MQYLGSANLQNPQQSQQPQPQQQNGVNPLLDMLGLTEAGIAGDVVAGPAGAGIATGGYRALTNYLTGKPLGQDVAETAATNAILPGIFGKVLGPLLGKVATDASVGGLNLTGKMLAKFGLENGVSAESVLSKFGLTGTDAEGLQAGLSKASKAYDAAANTSDPASQQAFIDNVNAAKQKILGNSQQIIPSSAVKTWNSLYQELKDNVFPQMGVTEDANGNLVANNLSQPRMSDLVQGKRAYDAQTTPAQFNADPAKYGVNRYIGNILRGTLNDSAEAAGNAGLKQSGIDLMNLHDLTDLANNRIGAGQSMFGLGNIIKKGFGAAVGGMAGGPLGAILGVAGESGAEAAYRNPLLAKIISAGARAGANNAGAIGRPVAALASMGLPLLGNNAGQSNNSNNNGSPNNGISNNSVQQPNQSNIPSFLQPSIAQSGSNVNGQTAGAGQTIKLSSGESLPAQLPDASQLGNNIPGQTYPQAQYLADRQKWTDYASANPYNPGVQTQAQLQINQIDQKKAQNDQAVQINLQQMGLTPAQSGFIMTAAPAWSALGDLQQAMTSSGGSGLFNYIINSNPQVVAARAATDPQFGHMVQLMDYAKEEVGKMYAGGALTDTQANMFKNAFSPANSIATNTANLEQVMKQIYGQYKQYAPFFHMQLNAPQDQQQTSQAVSNNDFLNYLKQKSMQ